MQVILGELDYYVCFMCFVFMASSRALVLIGGEHKMTTVSVPAYTILNNRTYYIATFKFTL